MQQTFPAGTAQRILISKLENDLIVHGWQDQTIKVSTHKDIAQLQPEGDALMISGCESQLELWVPLETIIQASGVEGDAVIEGVREVEIIQVNGDARLKGIGGNIHLENVEGDVSLQDIRGKALISDVEGDLSVRNAPELHLRGEVQGDASLLGVRLVDIDSVQGDVTLQGSQEAKISNIGNDLSVKEGIETLNCNNIGDDCIIQGGGNADIALNNVGNDLSIQGAIRVKVQAVGDDCKIQGNANAEVVLSHIGSDLMIIGASSVQVGHIGSDCVLRDVQGDVTVGQIGSDAHLLGIGGDVRTDTIGSDAELKGLRGNIDIGTIGSDLSLQADFPTESHARLRVGGDAKVLLPAQANLSIHAQVGGDVKGRSVVTNRAGNVINLTYGEGIAQLELQVGGDLVLTSNETPRSSSSAGNPWDWQGFGQDMVNLGLEMEKLSRNLGHDISSAVQQATSSIGADITSDMARIAEQQGKKARKLAEEQRRRAEHMQRQHEKQWRKENAYFNVRINEREWQMGPERIERIIEQARRAASEGILGALEAVEQALSNLRIATPPTVSQPPTPASPSEPAQPPTPPAPPQAPANVVAEPAIAPEAARKLDEENASVSPEQEREAILRMIAEGRITPEEGDLLLEALGE